MNPTGRFTGCMVARVRCGTQVCSRTFRIRCCTGLAENPLGPWRNSRLTRKKFPVSPGFKQLRDASALPDRKYGIRIDASAILRGITGARHRACIDAPSFPIGGCRIRGGLEFLQESRASAVAFDQFLHATAGPFQVEKLYCIPRVLRRGSAILVCRPRPTFESVGRKA